MNHDLSQEQLFAGKFRMLKLLGRGAMGEVWLAIEEGPRNFSRQVAVKRLLSSEGMSDIARQSFVAEAQALAHLDHPNIVRLIELGESDDRGLYLVLDYVDGAALDKIIRKSGQLSPAATALIGREVARALDAVHSLADEYGRNLGVVHRDVSPANILLGKDGRVRLSDFGVARITGLGGEKTETGVFKGKLPYMPPEQAMGEPFDGRADIFSLGITIFEAMFGGRLRRAETQGQLIAMIATERAPRVFDRLPEAPPALAQVIDMMTEFTAANRIANAGQLAILLNQVLQSLGPGAEDAARSELRERVLATVAAAGQARAPWSLALSSENPAYQSQPSAASVRVGSGTSGVHAMPSSVSSSIPSASSASSSIPSASSVESVSSWGQQGQLEKISVHPSASTGNHPSVTRIASISDARKPAPAQSRALVWAAFALLVAGGAATGAWIAFSRAPHDGAPGSASSPAVSSGAPGASGKSSDPVATQTVNLPEVSASAHVPETPVSALPSVASSGHPVAPPVRPVPTPPKPEPSAEDSSSPGTLMVVVNPWGNVSVDGRALGATPIAPVSLSPGTHTVVVTNPELGATRSQTVKVQGGKQAFAKFDLKKTD
jgi:serine/threonine-protein kinase